MFNLYEQSRALHILELDQYFPPIEISILRLSRCPVSRRIRYVNRFLQPEMAFESVCSFFETNLSSRQLYQASIICLWKCCRKALLFPLPWLLGFWDMELLGTTPLMGRTTSHIFHMTTRTIRNRLSELVRISYPSPASFNGFPILLGESFLRADYQWNISARFLGNGDWPINDPLSDAIACGVDSYPAPEMANATAGNTFTAQWNECEIPCQHQSSLRLKYTLTLE